jgi:methylmalonyl-CoA mutase, N-terminal domain
MAPGKIALRSRQIVECETPNSSAMRPGRLGPPVAEQSLGDLDAPVLGAVATQGVVPRGTQNLLVPMKEALRRRATLGEVSDVLRGVFGVYQPSR